VCVCVYFTQMFATRPTAKRRSHFIEFYYYWTSYKVLYRPVSLRQWSIWNSFRKVIKINLLEDKKWKSKAILMTCSHLASFMKWILRRRRPLLCCWCNSTSLFGDKYRSVQRIKCSSICNYFNWSCSHAMYTESRSLQHAAPSGGDDIPVMEGSCENIE
jgi:hypothetical protein